MKFRTEITIPQMERKISHQDVILMLGSCFANVMGKRLKEMLFDVTLNPFGVIYNPESISNSIDALLEKEAYTSEDLMQHNDIWFSFDHYTKYAHTDRAIALDRINSEFFAAREKMMMADILVLSFGTSYVYAYKPTGKIVSNCHKIPAKEFNRYRLTAGQIVGRVGQVLGNAFSKRPELQVILTVSPVRHLKDGFVENQRSKAALLLAVEELTLQFPANITYFPSFEILLDDLRDYRYYAPDLVHPSETAEDYIWEHFSESAIHPESKDIINHIAALRKSVGHRPLHSDTEAYRKFRENTLGKVRKLKQQFPFLQWQNFPENKIF